MPRPGFYNDNEYRAYPFIFKPDVDTLPNSSIVDCGIIMGLDSEFDPALHSVWLKTVRRLNDVFEFEFDTDAPGASNTPLIFQRDATAEEWLTEDTESAPYVKDVNSCAIEPAWSGFLVTGPLAELNEALPNDGSLALGTNYILEPARIQSLVRTYLRTISVGNLSRPISTSACDEEVETNRYVVINKRCVTGDIRFKEGYNAQVRLRATANEIAISAGRGLGQQPDTALCETNGEVPFYDGEQTPVMGSPVPTVYKGPISAANALPDGAAIGDTYGFKTGPVNGVYSVRYYTWNNAGWFETDTSFSAADDFPSSMPSAVQQRSKFFSGGPACNELVSSINGVPGPEVTIIGGTGIKVTTDPDSNTIRVELSPTNIAGSC